MFDARSTPESVVRRLGRLGLTALLLLVMVTPASAQFPATGLHSWGALSQKVQALRSCLSVLPPVGQRVLSVPFGLAGPPLAPSAAASQLKLSLPPLTAQVLRAVRILEARQVAGKCPPTLAPLSTGPTAGARAPSLSHPASRLASFLPSAATTAKRPASVIAATSSAPSMSSPTSLLLIMLIIGSAIMLVWTLAREFRH